MPPIFGIVHTHLQKPDQEMVSRMKAAAGYVIPREVVSAEIPGAFMAAAVRKESAREQAKTVLYEQGPCMMAADACLYKREELLKRMGRVGERESGSVKDGERGGQGDASLILEAYLKWGEECLPYLYGDFAFVIFNRETGEVFCGRDPLGVRPLFYSLHDQYFVFGSELRYVLAALPEKPPIRQDYLLDTLMTVKSGKELAPFENTCRLKPGNFLRADRDKCNIRQYWQADPQKKIRFGHEEEYIEAFREKLTDAVQARCQGVINLGTELSGGLDSSAICGIAADFARQEEIIPHGFFQPLSGGYGQRIHR